MQTTGDQRLVKRINRSVLLRLIRARPGLSRAQLAHQSGLTKSTVSTAVRELLDEGWLMEAESTPAGEAGARQGRPSTPLRINPASRGLVGVEVAVDCLRAVGVNLLGEVLWSAEEPLGCTEPAAVCAQAATPKAIVQRLNAEVSKRLLANQALRAKFTDKPSVQRALEVMGAFPGVQLDERATPVAWAGKDDVAVGRVRPDLGDDYALNLWVVGDNLLKGAALNTVQIAELLHERKLVSA